MGLTDEQWEALEPLIPDPQRRVRRGGGQRERGYRLPAGQGPPYGRVPLPRSVPTEYA